jgi:hypothetical protein
MSELGHTAIIQLGTKSLSIYMLASGEKRIDIQSTCSLLNKPDNWIKASDRQVIDVIDLFGYRIPLETISFKTFINLVTTEAIGGSDPAIVILSTFAEIGVESLMKFIDNAK